MTASAASGTGGALRLGVCALAVLLIAEAIGTVSFKLGSATISLLPMVWALLMGAGLGMLSPRVPRALAIDTRLQHWAAAILQPALLLFVAKLGLLVGGSLPKLAQAGWALVFQELGNLIGSILVAMPVALMLGIKREAVGATFSIGREPGLAIIGEKFGMNSPEGRGILAEYITGTLLGAVFISIFAGLVASLGIFSPIALAMGSGVGSGSMTAAAVGAVAAQYPELQQDIGVFAAASNLITTTIGTWFTLFISLPFAIWVYRKLEPVLGRRADITAQAGADVAQPADVEPPELSAMLRMLVWGFAGALSLLSNRIAFGTPIMDALPGMALIVLAVAIGDVLYHALRRKVPAVLLVSLVAMAMVFPAMPFAAEISAITGKVSFLALITIMLTFAGLSIAKDIPAFRRLGWRIVVVSLLANAGAFLVAAIIAEIFLPTGRP